MRINQLRLDHFRNFADVTLRPSPSFNLIYGDNGAGKSSLLEAIHLLGYGRSFRTNKPNTLIQSEFDTATSFCRFDQDGKEKCLGASRHKDEGFMFNVDGQKSRRVSDIAKVLPIQIFTPQSSDLIIGAPMLRRRFIDWLVFHVEQNFYSMSNAYANALLQRNALLKQSGSSGKVRFLDQDVWTPMMVNNGMCITALRKEYLVALDAQLKGLYSEFSPDVEVELRYNQGWEVSSTLEESLNSKLERDLLRGTSSSGPHKADIQFYLNGKLASEYLSRGQLRVLVSLLLIAEVRVLKQKTNKSCIFLVDDIAAELDTTTREFFLDTIVAEETQVFVTAIEKQQLSFAEKYKNKKVFHVKHNHVNEE